MKKFNNFYFKSFEFSEKKYQAKFNYSFDNDVFFEEIIDFKTNLFNPIKKIDLDVLNNILFNIHIALGISYYKVYPTKNMIIESGFLNQEQILFWKNFYINGLGEFLYTNNILPNKLFNFINTSKIKYIKKEFKVGNKSLIAIGGGKDSIVSIELFKKNNINFDLFVFGKMDFFKKNTGKIANKNILLIKRKISKNLIELNNQGYYNGHVPITGIIAFIMEITAYLYNYKYLVLSNEKSANFGNTIWNGFKINHQYSKSLNFEKDFGIYVKKHITSEVKYFSILRGMYEVKIAEYFSFLGKKYFPIFSSCNKNFKINNDKFKINNNSKYWCNKCSKCLFVYSILRPYLTGKEVIDIFGEDIFEKKDSIKIFEQLLGVNGIKPFECVGEIDEMKYSMNKSLVKYSKKNIPYVLKYFLNLKIININEKEINIIEKKLVTISSNDIIPKKIKDIIFKNIQTDEKKELFK